MSKIFGGSDKATLMAFDRSQALIEFKPDGTILTANKNFLEAVGYTLDEIRGKHHSIFVTERLRESDEYKEFWRDLGCGEFKSGAYKRVAKSGDLIWIQASYNPVFKAGGKVEKVVKIATEITEAKLRSLDHAGQIEAVSKSQAVIHFDLDGNILGANENFLNTVGYTLGEIQGRHHSIFVEPDFAESAEYKGFWRDLKAGEFKAGEFKRVNKAGEDVWIQASYNPILDELGNPFKVVKFATDITAQKKETAEFEGQIDAIGKSQAVIHFELDGTIIDANKNFLDTLGYSLAEIKGKHHRMFVEPSLANSAEYAEFWRGLADGRFQSGDYRRLGKGGKEIWISASYNPILDADGVPFKVVKFATDITTQIQEQRHRAETQKEIDQELDDIGVSITDANEQAAASASASVETSSSVTTVSSAVDQMAASVQEISREVQQAMEIARKAEQEAQQSNEIMAGLSGDAKSYAERLFSYPKVGPLDPTAARQAINGPIEDEGEEITDDALKKVIEVTEGYPYFLQEWGFQAWNTATDSPITVADIDVATDAALKRLDDGFFQVRFDRLTPKEREYVIAMSELGKGPYRSSDVAEQLGEPVNRLGPRRAQIIAKGMIYSPQYGDIDFTVPMFDDYLRRNWKADE